MEQTTSITTLVAFSLIASIALPNCGSLSAFTEARSHNEISIHMPDIRPDHKEQYLCVAQRVPVDTKGYYIVGFNPRGDANRVHHMLMYGCRQPGYMEADTPHKVWDCGEMSADSSQVNKKSYVEGPVCQGNQHILYGWALDAPALKLPKGVGFKIGGLSTDIRYLVLQVHYGHYHAFASMPDLTDNSGLVLDIKPNEIASGITKQAGVLLMLSVGHVEQGVSKHEIWCDINEDIELHPFRFRVHTHKLGTRVLGAKLKSNVHQRVYENQVSRNDIIIGQEDPQKPQMFYPVKEAKDIVIRKGDTVYASCEFNNTKSHIVNIGMTGDDEMCNFYMMYWTSSPNLLTRSSCFGENPQTLLSQFYNAFGG